MKGNNQERIQELENIIRALADVWPADRENVTTAGAQFEEFVDGYDENVGQLQKLIDLAWDGLKYLYKKNEFFMSVKAATIKAVNTIREYLIHDGDIQVEDFEKACIDLEKSLRGGGESADTVIELDEQTDGETNTGSKTEHKEAATVTTSDSDEDYAVDSKAAAEEDQPPSPSLDDLAAFIITLDDESITREELAQMGHMLEGLVSSSGDEDSGPLNEAYDSVKKAYTDDSIPEGFLASVSERIEEAVEMKADRAWQQGEKKTAGNAKQPDKEQNAASTTEDQKAKDENAEPFCLPDDMDEAMIGEFISECTDLLEMAEGALLDLEESPDDDELINQIFRSFHTIKGTSAFMGLEPISEFTHLLETLLDTVREGELEFSTACADISLESIDVIKQMLRDIETSAGGDPLPLPGSYESLITVLNNISGEGMDPEAAFAEEREAIFNTPAPVATNGKPEATENLETAANEGPDNSETEDIAAEKSSGKTKTESSVRVNVSRLDRLIDMIGELVIAHSVVAQDKAIPNHSELQKKVNHTTKILRELQDTSLTLRMVPLKATFQKMNRLVRDLSRKAGKAVNLTTFGEDTEIDRNMVDVINEPLVHMVRNAIDHGIENPEEREKSGKSPKANVSLRASQEGGLVLIEIEDDGRGIDKDKVLKKAIDKGLVSPDEKLTDKEIYNLIFLPGFSSVDKVTDLSGRGVGMDVVRKSIEQLQGKIDVTSEVGKGTKISLELPFTLAITDGMLVNVGDQQFIIPTINIDMAFRAKEKDIFTVMGNSEKVSFRGQSVPVVRLHELFGVRGGAENLMKGTMLVIRNGSRKYALLVDEVVGQQQLVGKSINMINKTDHISGGAILGDGRVGLILDTASLMN